MVRTKLLARRNLLYQTRDPHALWLLLEARRVPRNKRVAELDFDVWNPSPVVARA